MKLRQTALKWGIFIALGALFTGLRRYFFPNKNNVEVEIGANLFGFSLLNAALWSIFHPLFASKNTNQTEEETDHRTTVDLQRQAEELQQKMNHDNHLLPEPASEESSSTMTNGHAARRKSTRERKPPQRYAQDLEAQFGQQRLSSKKRYSL